MALSTESGWQSSAAMHLTVEQLHTNTHTHAVGPILIKEMTHGWRREGRRCGHAGVATVTAVSKD